MLASAFTGARLAAPRSFVGQQLEAARPQSVAAPAAFTVEAAHKKGSGSTKNGAWTSNVALSRRGTGMRGWCCGAGRCGCGRDGGSALSLPRIIGLQWRSSNGTSFHSGACMPSRSWLA